MFMYLFSWSVPSSKLTLKEILKKERKEEKKKEKIIDF